MSFDAGHFEESRVIIGAIRDWPLHERLELVAQILNLASEEVRPRGPALSAEELQARLGTDKGMNVSDEQIEQWLHERHLARAR
jgi:hypothetical protein